MPSPAAVPGRYPLLSIALSLAPGEGTALSASDTSNAKKFWRNETSSISPGIRYVLPSGPFLAPLRALFHLAASISYMLRSLCKSSGSLLKLLFASRPRSLAIISVTPRLLLSVQGCKRFNLKNIDISFDVWPGISSDALKRLIKSPSCPSIPTPRRSANSRISPAFMPLNTALKASPQLSIIERP